MKNLKVLCLLLFSLSLSGCQQEEVGIALGTLEKDRYLVTAPVSETLVSLQVREGQAVKKGQLIARLESTLADSDVNKATAALAGAKARLKELERGARTEEIAAANARVEEEKASLKEAGKNFGRTQLLVERGVQGKAELDSALALRDSTAARLEETEQQLALLKAGSRKEQIQQARAEVSQAESHLDGAVYRQSQLLMTAPVDGWIDSLPWHQGERVQADTAVAVMLAAGSPYARVYVPETERINLRVGDRLNVHVDGSDRLYNGTVRWLSEEPMFTPYYALTENDRARLVYEMEVQLGNDGAGRPSGLPAQVELP